MTQLKIVISEKQKTSRISYLNDRIQQIKRDLENPASAIHELYASNSPKKDLILQWAHYTEELHDYGVYSDDVNTISTYIKSELKKMGLEQAVHYVHEVLPFKYKNEEKSHREDQDDLSGPTTQNDSEKKPKSFYINENKHYIECINITSELLKFLKKQLQERHFESVLVKEEMEEFLTAHENLVRLTYNVWNEKRKDMTQTHAALFELVTHFTPSHAAGEYMSKIKDMFKLTGKQATKILKREIRDLHPLYDPKNKVEACLVGFYGQRCGNCGSWRVKYLPQKTLRKHIFHVDVTREFQCYCFQCKEVFDAKTEKIVVK